MDGAFAVTSQLERIAHQTGPVLAHIECMLLVVRRLGATIWDDHLNNTHPIEQHTITFFIRVMDADIGKDDALAIIKTLEAD